MSVSNISSADNLSAILQRFKTQQSTRTEGALQSDGTIQKSPEDLMAQALKDQGLDDDAISQIQKEVRFTMEEQRDQVAKGTATPQGMRENIDSILKQHGVDTDSFNSFMQQNMPQMPADRMGGGPPPMGVNMSADGVDLYA